MSQVRSEEDQRNLAYYCKCFSNLRVYQGTALHKPILLLSVIDLISQDLITTNKILISDELEEAFEQYWNIITQNPPTKISYPCFHLQTDGFWHLEYQENVDSSQYEQIRKSTIKFKKVVKYAYLDQVLFDLIKNDEYRTQLIDTLIASWFSASQTKIEKIIDINDRFIDNSEDSGGIETIKIGDSIEKPTFRISKSVVRKAFFRKSIVQIYDYRCAFCRLKVQRSLKQFIVDGAHIKRLSEFYDNSIDNGLSLCKNHHWAFDMGWFFIDDDYSIRVADDLEEDSPYARPMKDFHGERILLPSSETDFPSLEALYWHRKKVFEAYS